jgi:putative ABC transport system permease protein
MFVGDHRFWCTLRQTREAFMNDVRYALRLLRKSRLFTLTVTLTLAVGIGAATTIFSVVNAVLVRSLPFAAPDRLMQVAEKNDTLRLPAFSASNLNYLSWKEQTQTFEQLGAIQFGTYTLSGRGDPETYTGSSITSSVMPLLGLQPLAGRVFGPDDEKVGAAPVALISQTLWTRRFDGDPSIVGRPATLNGTGYTIVGIAPPALNLLTNGDIWVPLIIDPSKEMRLNHQTFVVGRLKPGVTEQTARAEMDAIAARVGQQYPEVKDWGVNLITFTDTFVSAQLRTALLVLLGAVMVVLLIVSANVANLLLSRALDRQKEVAVRAALGASRARLLRQLLIESLALSSVGGVAGLVVGALGIKLLEAALPPNVLPVPDIGMDRIVVIFALALTFLTGIIFGLAPAWHGARVDVNTTLKATGRSSSGVRPMWRKGLAGAELALATILLIGAALLSRSLLALQHVPLGFDPDGVMAFQVSVPPTKYPAPKRIAFYRELGQRLKALPGVRDAGISSGIPFGAGNYTQSPVAAPGSPSLPAGTSVPIDWRIVGSGYFATVKIPLLRGRDFTDADTGPTSNVMIISVAAGRSLWGDADPMGRTVRRVADGADFTIVGVVGDVRSRTLNRESPALYYPAGRAWSLMDIVVRPVGDAASVMSGVRQIVRELDPEVPLTNVRPMTEWVSSGAAQPRLNATLLGVFAAMALLVSAIGTYGVLAYSVSQRTKELGLRLALGADRRGLLALVVGEGMRIGAVGIVVGVIAAAAMGRLLSSLVFNVSVWDPLTYASVATVLGVVALISCVIPALRASRIDPMEALRLD